MKQKDFLSLSVLPGFPSGLVSVSYFYPFFHPSHHTADLSHLLSLGDLSSPYHSAPALFWFSSRCSLSLITSLSLLPPLPPTLCVLSSFSLCNISALPPLLFPPSLSLSLPPADPPTSLPHTLSLCHVEVEPFVGIPRRRPLSFCPCCSPEGNVTLPPLPTVVAGYHGNRKDLQKTGLPPSSPLPIILPTGPPPLPVLTVFCVWSGSVDFPRLVPKLPEVKRHLSWGNWFKMMKNN